MIVSLHDDDNNKLVDEDDCDSNFDGEWKKFLLTFVMSAKSQETLKSALHRLLQLQV